MSSLSFTVRPERPDDLPAIQALSARAFGPGRFARTAYRLRECARPVADLCLTAWSGDRLVGALRFTPIAIGGAEGALLLGPLVVAPEVAGQGCGRGLIGDGLARARSLGFRLVVLVGDLPYYAGVGFDAVPRGQILLPGPVDPARILAFELEPGVLGAYRGLMQPAL